MEKRPGWPISLTICYVQCDRMAKLCFQYWAINSNENLSNQVNAVA